VNARGRSSHALVVACIAAACAIPSQCAVRQARAPQDFGIPACADGAGKDLLASDALQCWFTAAHGRWRMLNHQSHLDAIVVEVEARDLDDADEIARRVVASVEAAYSEVLVYVQAESPVNTLRLRRVRWTRDSGYDRLDF
jgi:hypothetical protein